MDEIKITETVYKQSGCSSWNPKNKQTYKDGSVSPTSPSPSPPRQHTYNSAFDIFENITMKFE